MSYVSEILPPLLQGAVVSVELFVITLVLALPLGLPFAFGEMSRFRPIRWICKVFVFVFRGTPLMLQLFFFYFGAAMIKLSNGENFALAPFTASVIAFVLNYAAYFAEIFRGGIIGVNKGQYEASKALGLTGIQTMRYVVVPQMIRTVIPPIANETIVLVKDTALASSIALIDLLKASQRAVNRDMKISPLLMAALFYLVITLLLTFAFNYLEKRLSISEQGIK